MADFLSNRTLSPKQHAFLDYGMAATFLSLAFRFRGRNNAASTLAFITGGMILGISLFTDYPGGVWRRISFKTHQKLHAIQAAITGIGPSVLGFGHTGAARTFQSQAASEAGVIAMTDWED